MKFVDKGLLVDILELMRLSVFHSGAFYGKIAFDTKNGKINKPALLISSFFPMALCLILLWILRPEGDFLKLLLLLGFVVLTPFLAGLVFFIVGKLFGSTRDYCSVCAGWAHSYWATDLFLVVLVLSHQAVGFLGFIPSGIPGWLGYVFLSLYVSAGLWKLLMMISLLKFLFKLKGLRLGMAVILMLVSALGFALLSAILFGTKVPIV